MEDSFFIQAVYITVKMKVYVCVGYPVFNVRQLFGFK